MNEDELLNAIMEMEDAGIPENEIQSWVNEQSAASEQITETLSEDHDFNVANMVGNIPESSLGLVKNIATAAMNPWQTAKAVGNLALGTVQKAIPGEQDAEKYADAFSDAMVERYGSIEKFQKTLEEDPVGVLADASAIIMPIGSTITTAGKVAAGANKASKVANIVQKIGRVVSKTGAAIDPLNIALSPVKAAGKAIVNAIPDATMQNVYGHGLQFGSSVPLQDRGRILNTALKEGIMPNLKGMNKIDDIVSSIDDNISKIISEKGINIKVPRSATFKHLQSVREKHGGVNISGIDNMADIDTVARKFSQQLDKIKKKDLTLDELQNMKKKVYNEVAYDKRMKTSKQVVDDTKKAIARAGKEIIEEKIPEVGPLNVRQGQLLGLKETIAGPAARAADRPTLPLNFQMKMLVGSALGGEAGAGLGFLVGLMDKSSNRARSAISAYKLKNTGLSSLLLDNSIVNAAMRQTGIQAGEYSDVLKNQSLFDFDTMAEDIEQARGLFNAQ